MKILAPLNHRNFRLLYTGQVISDLGDWLTLIALITTIAYRMNLGPWALAALSVAMILPRVIIGPLAGVWVDRWSYRKVMIAADLIRAGLAFWLVFAPDLYLLLLLVFLAGGVGTFFSPARQASIRHTLPESDLLQANALSQLSVQGSKIIGPAIGGVLVSLFSSQAAFIADAISFLASALILSFLPELRAEKALEPARPDAEPGTSSFWAEFKAGVLYIFKNRRLAIAVVSTTLAIFIILTFDSLGALALKQLNIGQDVLGFAVGSVGLGTALGAFLIGQWGQRLPALITLAGGNLVGGLSVAFLGLAILMHFSGLSLAMIPVWLVVGLAGAAMFVPYGYILQSETPPEMLGRVASTAGAIQTTFQLLAPPLGAVLAEWLGIGPLFGLAGLALFLSGILVIFMTRYSLEPTSRSVQESASLAEAKTGPVQESVM